MQVHYCFVKGKMLPPENGSKEAESQLSQTEKEERKMWGEGEKNRKKNLYIPLHLLITRPIFHI